MRTALLLVFFATLFLYGIGAFNLIDYDEACYAEAAREMLVSGDYLSPHVNGKPFFEKPPLLYWIQVIGYRAFGTTPFGARIGNSLAALISVTALYLFARGPLGSAAALLAAGLLGTGLMFFYLARIAMTDMLLTACFVMCLGCGFRALEAVAADRARGTAWFIGACLFSALAILAKGAVGLVLPAAGFLLFLLITRRLRLALRPSWILVGPLLVCLLGFSWYLLLGFTREDGFGFMRELFLEHHVERFTSPMQHHTGSLLYYVPIVLLGMMPWSPFLPMAIIDAWRQRRPDAESRFTMCFLSFSVVTFAFFSIAATKLPNYIAPAAPGFALAVAVLLGSPAARARYGRGWAISAGFSALTAVFLALVFILLPRVPSLFVKHMGEDALRDAPGLAYPLRVGPGPYIAAAACLLYALSVPRALRSRRPAAIGWASFGLSAVLCVLLSSEMIPRYHRHFMVPLRTLAIRAGSLVSEDDSIVLLGLRKRPSINFYSKRRTEYCSGKKPERMQRVFSGTRPRIGITIDTYFQRLREHVPHVEVVTADTGYVLFRCGLASAEP